MATTIVAFVGETYGFEYGFGRRIGMLAGLAIFWIGRDNYSAAAGLDTEDSMARWPTKMYRYFIGSSR